MLVSILSSFFYVTKAAAIDNATCDLNELNGQKYHTSYGPYDYTNPSHYKNKLPIVEGAHFNSNVERLISGMSGSLAADIGYTLHAFPNHHRALNAMAKLQRLAKSDREFTKNNDRIYTAACYFKRAIHFKSNDTVSRMLYGMHLHLTKNLNSAEQQYLLALASESQNTELNYNIGLLYVDMGLIEKAKKHADVAYSNGYPLQGLANKIKKNR
jgi:hypothetical protein